MSDLTDRLRELALYHEACPLSDAAKRAANHIDALTAERDAAVRESILRTEDCQDAIGRHTTALRERDEARAKVEHLTAEMARLREALDDYADRLRMADGELTLIIATKQVGPEFTRLNGKREGVRLAADYLRPFLAEKDTDQ